MSSFFEHMFGGGNSADDPEYEAAWSAAKEAADAATDAIFARIEKGGEGLSDMKKIFVLMVAAHLAFSRIKESVERLCEREQIEGGEAVRKMWTNIEMIFAMSAEERRAEVEKHRRRK